MNIFVVDEDPVVAARSLCNKHVVKMILESIQMLSYATDVYLGSKSHYNHPCSRWARETSGNWLWLYQHTRELLREYTHRYGKRHAWAIKLELLDPSVPDGPLTPFVQAVPEQYKQSDPIQAYRDYYNAEKAHFAQWKRREPPSWFRKDFCSHE